TGQKAGKTGEEDALNWEKFPYSGLIKVSLNISLFPHSNNEQGYPECIILYLGVKTNMGILGVDNRVKNGECEPELLKKARLDSIMNWGAMIGKEVGIVTTTRLTHATPGAVYSNSPSRDWESDIDIPADQKKGCLDIATQLLNNVESGNLALAFGGGLQKFRTVKNGGVRNDIDLVDKMKSAGIEVLKNTGELQRWTFGKKTVGLFSPSHMDFETKRDKSESGQPSLSEMTRQAINRLSKNNNGFVLMVEGGRIDHAHHENLGKMALEETVELDKAVHTALDLVNIKETLVLVTADHSHAVTMSGYPKRGNNILGTVYEPDKTISYANGPGFKDHWTPTGWRDVSKLDYNGDDYRQPAMFFAPYETHGGEDVSVFARGPQAHLVTGLHEQSFLGLLMGYAACMNKKEFGCPVQDYSSSSASLSFRTTFSLPLVMIILKYVV
ncbi:alkaline phosphatase, tissue-nonspecific isozyme, partial [Eurytemora carolleeae]|uniref:alkaline phosphatase, tissue-nonspecific isozyme n=1 Tax=Eurytemora carolleeae TaxID=1294199 RepID=UPI000C77B5ED